LNAVPPLATSPAELIPFALLLAAVLGLWIHRTLWIGALIAAVAVGYATGAVTGLAALWIALLAALACAYRLLRDRPPTPVVRAAQLVAGVVFFLFALAVALPLLPGFPRTTLIADAVLSRGAAPYGIGLGFPKVTTGIVILGIINETRVRSWAELGRVSWRAVSVFMVTALVVMAIVLAVRYVRWDPRWTPVFLVWAPVNLFFTCLAEEAFFRGFVQAELAGLGRRWVAAGLIAGAVTFGLAHFAGGTTYVIVAALAGVGYGLAYLLTKRIEAAMAVHFGVNAVHFLLFTYPRLA
jgi:uncharacterized protein